MSYNQLFAITTVGASLIEPLPASVANLSSRLHARGVQSAAEAAAAQRHQPSQFQLKAIGEVTIRPFGSVSTSNETLAALLDQSLDCIKLISADGAVQYMNPGGLCAMEIDDFETIGGRQWVDLWPEEVKPILLNALEEAKTGKAVRFDAFCPTAKGAARWWDVSVSLVKNVSGDLIGFLSVSRDVTEAQLAKEVAETAAAEMVHRLGNSYAMVGALLSAFARGNPQLEVFASEMRERLAALAVAQTASVGDAQRDGTLKELMEEVLRAFATPRCPIIVEPFLRVPVDQAEAHALALVFGELAVNSAKHGALSANGKIRLKAEIDDQGVVVHWQERSDRPVEATQRTAGQGLKLMTRILNSARGVLTVDWAEFGLDACIQLPRP